MLISKTYGNAPFMCYKFMMILQRIFNEINIFSADKNDAIIY